MIPVVIVSSDAIDRQIQRLLEAGASAYFSKPLDTHRLVDTSSSSSANRTRHSTARQGTNVLDLVGEKDVGDWLCGNEAFDGDTVRPRV